MERNKTAIGTRSKRRRNGERYVSLELWLMLTWSLGWMSFLSPSWPPRISIARFAITSFTFMFVCAAGG